MFVFPFYDIDDNQLRNLYDNDTNENGLCINDYYNLKFTYNHTSDVNCDLGLHNHDAGELENLHSVLETIYYHQDELEPLVRTYPNHLNIFTYNIRSIPSNLDMFVDGHLIPIINEVQIICFCETRLSDDIEHLYRITGFNMFTKNRNRQGGGVAIYIKDNINCKVIDDISIANDCYESCFVECESVSSFIVGVIYRRPNSDINVFNIMLEDLLGKIKLTKKLCYILRDININLFRHDNVKNIQNYADILYSHGFYSCINKPTRITDQGASLIDHVWFNDYNITIKPGILVTDVTDHFSPFIICPRAAVKAEQKTFKYRNFSKVNNRDLCSTLESLIEECEFNDEVSDNAKKITEYIVKATDTHVPCITLLNLGLVKTCKF